MLRVFLKFRHKYHSITGGSSIEVLITLNEFSCMHKWISAHEENLVHRAYFSIMFSTSEFVHWPISRTRVLGGSGIGVISSSHSGGSCHLFLVVWDDCFFNPSDEESSEEVTAAAASLKAHFHLWPYRKNRNISVLISSQTSVLPL